jgi:hypothetical protein
MRDMAGEMEAASRNAMTARGFELESLRIARLMKERYTIGFVDIGGWDTHVGQGGATGYLAGRFEELGRGFEGDVAEKVFEIAAVGAEGDVADNRWCEIDDVGSGIGVRVENRLTQRTCSGVSRVGHRKSGGTGTWGKDQSCSGCGDK